MKNLMLILSLSIFAQFNVASADEAPTPIKWSCTPCGCLVHYQYKTEMCSYSLVVGEDIAATFKFGDNYGNDLGACLEHRESNPNCQN
jgi:hypothetical protein